MPLPQYWATPEDFATLFQYMWYRDFPMSDTRYIGARRTDWTIHIGLVVRSIADLMGLATRFERGGRKDAMIRSSDGDEIALEWEWDGVWGANELTKLKNHKVFSPDKDPNKLLRYAVLITYTHTPNIEKVCDHVTKSWAEAKWPLLLILIDLVESKKFPMGKEFNNINMFLFDCDGEKKTMRVTPAFPWNIERTRWTAQTI